MITNALLDALLEIYKLIVKIIRNKKRIADNWKDKNGHKVTPELQEFRATLNFGDITFPLECSQANIDKFTELNNISITIITHKKQLNRSREEKKRKDENGKIRNTTTEK